MMLTISVGGRGCGKSEQQRQALGMTIEEFDAYTSNQRKLALIMDEAEVKYKEAFQEFIVAKRNYLESFQILDRKPPGHD